MYIKGQSTASGMKLFVYLLLLKELDLLTCVNIGRLAIVCM